MRLMLNAQTFLEDGNFVIFCNHNLATKRNHSNHTPTIDEPVLRYKEVFLVTHLGLTFEG